VNDEDNDGTGCLKSRWVWTKQRVDS